MTDVLLQLPEREPRNLQIGVNDRLHCFTCEMACTDESQKLPQDRQESQSFVKDLGSLAVNKKDTQRSIDGHMRRQEMNDSIWKKGLAHGIEVRAQRMNPNA